MIQKNNDYKINNSYKNKRILITGGLGFIGSNLAISLVERGAKVFIIDALIKGYGGNLFNIEPIKKKVSWEIGDIRDRKKVDSWVKSKQIIFNLAGTLSHLDSMVDPITDLEINCRAQLTFLESVRKNNPSARIIFAGTRNQYGKAQFLPVTEDHPQEPTDINGINSIAAEKYHLMYTEVYGIKTVSLRMTNTYGPRHQMKHEKQGVLNWFIRKVMDGETVTLFGGGKQIRDVNYIDDVVEALLTVGSSRTGWGEAYNLGGKQVSLIDFVQSVITINSRFNLEMGCPGYVFKQFPKDREKIEVGDYIASIEKIKKTFGWMPKVSLEAGIKETVEYYRKYRRYYWK